MFVFRFHATNYATIPQKFKKNHEQKSCSQKKIDMHVSITLLLKKTC